MAVSSPQAVSSREWWRRPQLRTDEEEHRERRVTWLDLFYDLVYVALISELSHLLVDEISWERVLGFALLFIPVWFNWIGWTFYSERFETEDISFRVFTFLKMVPTAFMAVFMHDALGSLSAQFALAHVGVRVLIVLLWLRGGWHVPEFRPVSNRYAVGFSISIALFIASVFVEPPFRFVLWLVGLLIDLVTPVPTLKFQARLPRVSTSRMPERFGLFTIIVLGESVVAVISGLAAGKALTLLTGVQAMVALGITFGLWWVYFDFVARRRARPGVWWFFAWGYLHLPLVMGITATAPGLLHVLGAQGGTLDAAQRLLLCGAVAVTLFTIGTIERTLIRPAVETGLVRMSSGVKFLIALAALSLSAVGLGASGLLVALFLLIALVMFYGALIWARYFLPRT